MRASISEFLFRQCCILIIGMVLVGCSNSKTSTTTTWPETFRLGREATAEEIAALDIDVGPNGKGLPEGQGLVSSGSIIFQQKCSRCHGVGGIDGAYGSLVTNLSDTLSQEAKQKAPKTIGNYWPYATTVYDYVNRAMPFDQPGSLTSDEVYHITAYLLYANRIIDATTVINSQTLPTIEMPAKKQFVLDDRKGGPEVR